MQFEIQHFTEYRFSRPVFLEPHELRFSPRTDGAQERISFKLEIEPRPAGVTEVLDPEGNLVTMAWFDGLHERLRTKAVSVVETDRENPFDYLLTKRAKKFPVQYSVQERSALAASCLRNKVSSGADPIAEMVKKISRAEEDRLLPCLNRLNQTIYERFEVIRREEGVPWAPAATFEMQRGACRDLAVLFVDACRSWGLAARFVSGYQEGDSDQDRRDLHAWAEVYVPGGGWRGYDPTHGLAVADRHVTVAASVNPEKTMPVTGTFRGTEAVADILVDLKIKVTEKVRGQKRSAVGKQQ